MKGRDTYPKKSATLFRQGYNCAQSVMLAMQDFWNENKTLEPKVASAFGGGIGRRGSLCGALTGGVIAIGQKYGSNRPLPEEREKAYSLALKFYERFQKENGSVYCRDLVGYNLADQKELKKARDSNVFFSKCIPVVERAVELLIDLSEST